MFRTMRGAWIGAAATLFLWSCASEGEAPTPAPTPSPQAAAPASLGTTPRDTERASLALGVAPLAIEADGAPRMLRAVGNQPAPVGLTAEAAARHHLARLAPLWLKGGKTADLELIESRTLSSGAFLVRFRQRVGGIEVYGGNLAVALKADGSLVSTSGLLRPAAPDGSPFALAPQQAVAQALSRKLDVAIDAGQFALTKSGEFQQLAAPPRTDVRVEAARTKRVYLPTAGKLTPAWFVEYVGAQRGTGPEHSYSYIIGASDGAVLREKDLSHDDTLIFRAYAEPTGERRPLDGPIDDFSPHPRGIPDGTYPASRAANLVAIDAFNVHRDPWIPDGVTVTTGNNVDAFTDRNGDDLPAAPDVRAEMTSPNAFDYTYDEALEPLANDTQSKAAVVNLFYVINWMHDWWYDAGFDEAAGNAQASNYGRGGVEGDPIRANAQDQSLAGPQGPQRGNANMNTPSDGLSPRMQMFLWQNPIATLQATPGGAVPTFRAVFGAASFDLTANLVAVDDGSTAGNGTVSDGCQPPVNSVAGAIALVDRGACNFTVKAKNVQDAGAVGIIIANNVPPFANSPGGADPTVTIPAMGTSQPAGVALRAALSQGPVSVRMVAAVGVERDGDFDNVVIGHEWGHYFHHRLSVCDNQLQCRSLSEGWGDFIALHLMVREGDNYDGTYGVGVFDTKSSSPDPAYLAIRRFPYSVDRTKNALTFRNIADNVPLPTTTPGAPGGVNSQWHNSGEVWASSLWEVYRALIAEHPFAEARRAMAEYVVLGLLLAPPEADYTTTRDAILLAISILNPDDLTTAAEAFASRGLGTCAVSPPPTSTNYNETVEDLGLSAKLATTDLEFSDDGASCDEDGFLDPGEIGTIRFQLANLGTAVAGPVTVTATTDTSGITIAPVTVESLGAFEVEDIELEVRAALDAPTNTALNIVVTASAPATCGDVTSVIAGRFGVDEVAGSSRTDSVDTVETSWLTAGEPEGLWFRTPIETGDTVWHGDDFGDVSDVQLVTPPLVVSATGGAPFTVTFQHRYLFETLFDGGVIELTSDGGATWVDVLTLGVDPGYTATLLDETGNPIEGRPAFTDLIPSGDFEELSLDFTPANLAGQTVQLRFRIGSDGGVGEYGWDIDDIAVAGIDNLPFVGLVPEEGTCQVPPVVDAGPAQSVEGGATVTLAGTATDENEDELTYAWTQVSGDPVTLTGADTLTPSFTAPTVATDTPLVFELSVSDGFQSASDQVTITVLRTNAAPVVVAGDDQTVDAAAAVTVTGSATDADDATETLTYAWTQQSGPEVTLSGADATTVSFTAPSPTTDSDVVLVLTATDPRGASGSDTVTIHVRRVNTAPVVDAGPAQTVTSGDTVTLAGVVTDAEGDTATTEWSLISGPAVTLSDESSLTPTFTAPVVTAAATIVLELAATDGLASATDRVEITVNPVATPPDAGVPDAGVPDAGMPPRPDAGGGDDDGGDDGCGCSTSSPAAAGNLLLSLAAVLGFLARRRRR